MEKKIQDLGEEHKKEISKIKKVCLYRDLNQGSSALMRFQEHSSEISKLNSEWETKMKSQADEYEKKITETKEKALAQVSFMSSYWLINTVF